MKAIVYDRYGDPDVLHLREWDAPFLGVGQVLIDVDVDAVETCLFTVGRYTDGKARPA